MTDQAEQSERLDLRSHDIAGDKVQEMLDLFPEVRTEGGQIDFDRLKLALGETVDVGKERYGLTWPGKAECFKTIQAPSLGTLLPVPEESINWDTTENLIIEGDNLEVLKLLQKAYLGKVKMIYIDPPYNTGNDFIYPDNYAESLKTYLEYTEQVDAEGRRSSTNTDTDGRFHSKWLNMMYPRLYLARNLLREDGVIFISIDDHEMHHLILLMNDIFGEENLLGAVTVVSNWKGRSDALNFASAHDSLVVYARGSFANKGLPLPDDVVSSYRRQDESSGRIFRLLPLRKSGSNSLRTDRPNMFYPLYVDAQTMTVTVTRLRATDVETWPLFPSGKEGRWRWGPETSQARIADLQGVNVRGKGWDVYERDWLDKGGATRRAAPKTVWIGPEYSSDAGTYEVKELLGEGVFPHPKPIGLLRTALEMTVDRDSVVLDFFAGSGTSAHAVLDLNKQDGGNRKFILVQLPEPTKREDFPTIAEITKERVRRVIAKLDAEDEGKLGLDGAEAQDRGFRVFKLAESNFRIWKADMPHRMGALIQQLELHVAHVTEDRSANDVLFEILLKSGYSLTTAVESVEVGGKQVFSVADGALLVCLDRHLTLEAVRAMAGREPKPDRVVCLDDGFAGDDQLKTNAVQLFETRDIVFRTA